MTLDVAVRWLHPLSNPTRSERIAALAVGGYGRGEMAPFSDIDLLFVTPYKQTAWGESLIESVLYCLWDLKLKVGHAVRTVDDCLRLARGDATIRTSLLEHRFLWGEAPLAERLGERLWSDVFEGTGPEFVELKLAERDARHARQGSSRYLLEPNVKEGKGGLRDLQTLFWIGKYLTRARGPEDLMRQDFFTPDEYTIFAEAAAFLWTTRVHLHLLSGRATEQLTFDMQVEIAAALGYRSTRGQQAVERFMQDYFTHAKAVGDLTRIFLSALEAQHVKPRPGFGQTLRNVLSFGRDRTAAGYRLKHGRLDVADAGAFLADPVNILRLFREGLSTGTLIHPDALRLVAANLSLIDARLRKDPEANRIFLELLLGHDNPERALRLMNEVGVLGAFIPEFGRIVAMMQFNMYHHYTVDEHIIRTISTLSQIEQGDLVEDLPVSSRDPLARRQPAGALCRAPPARHRQGLRPRPLRTRRRDRHEACAAPRTGCRRDRTGRLAGAQSSADVRHRPEARPRRAANRARFRPYREEPDAAQAPDRNDGLRHSRRRTERLEQLESDAAPHALRRDARVPYRRQPVPEPARSRDRRQGGPRRRCWRAGPTRRSTRECARHYAPYWLGFDTRTHAIFADLVRKLPEGEPAIYIELDFDRDATQACFAMSDHPGIFARLAGALALAGANVVDARTYTSTDGIATAAFWIQDAHGAPYERARLTRLRNSVRRILKGEVVARDALKSRDQIKKREKDFVVPTRVHFDNTASDIYTLIEVETRDRPGLLYDLARTLTANNISISSAIIATYGKQAVDVFYVKDLFGLKLHAEAKRKTLETRLRAVIDQADGKPD